MKVYTRAGEKVASNDRRRARIKIVKKKGERENVYERGWGAEKIQRNYFYSSGKKEKLLLFLRKINAKRRLVVSTRVFRPNATRAKNEACINLVWRGARFDFETSICVYTRARGHRYRIHWSDLHFNWILQDLTSSPRYSLTNQREKRRSRGELHRYVIYVSHRPFPIIWRFQSSVSHLTTKQGSRWFQRQDPQSACLASPSAIPPSVSDGLRVSREKRSFWAEETRGLFAGKWIFQAKEKGRDSEARIGAKLRSQIWF